MIKVTYTEDAKAMNRATNPHYMDVAILTGLIEIGKRLKKTSRSGQNRKGSGRLYGNHRASKAGQYPAKNTGRLLRGTDFRSGPRHMEFGSNVEYAEFMENGTKTIAPRPLLRNSHDENEKDFERIMENSVRKVMNL